jgi:osmotically-inducible protein OsmY
MNADRELQRAVKYNIYRALQRAALADWEQISVEINGGNVILRGACRSWAEREDAERAAWAISGVRSVQNELQVTGLMEIQSLVN